MSEYVFCLGIDTVLHDSLLWSVSSPPQTRPETLPSQRFELRFSHFSSETDCHWLSIYFTTLLLFSLTLTGCLRTTGGTHTTNCELLP